MNPTDPTFNPKTKNTKDGKAVVRNDNRVTIYDRSGNKLSDVVYSSVREAKSHMSQTT